MALLLNCSSTFTYKIDSRAQINCAIVVFIYLFLYIYIQSKRILRFTHLDTLPSPLRIDRTTCTQINQIQNTLLRNKTTEQSNEYCDYRRIAEFATTRFVIVLVKYDRLNNIILNIKLAVVQT